MMDNFGLICSHRMIRLPRDCFTKSESSLQLCIHSPYILQQPTKAEDVSI
ncbi:hypothetical protein LEMLEM_LOCUS22452 [Lemmus lemmus]